MNKMLLFLLASLVLGGCFAIVDEGSEGRKVKSFIITEEEALDILEKAREKDPFEKYEIKLFKKDQESLEE
jgi:hypothetical protein